jgi:flavin-dependent dehydrogenase
MMPFDQADLIVVGGGYFGLTVARLAAEKCNAKVLILEKQSTVGGHASTWTRSSGKRWIASRNRFIANFKNSKDHDCRRPVKSGKVCSSTSISGEFTAPRSR